MKLQHLKNHITSYKKIYQLLIISLIFQFFFIINLHSKEQIIILSTVSWEPGANLTWEHTSIHVCSWIWTRIWHPRIRAHTNLYVCVCVCMAVCLFVRGCLFVFCFSLYVCVHLSFHVARSSQKKMMVPRLCWEHIQIQVGGRCSKFRIGGIVALISPTVRVALSNFCGHCGFVKLLWFVAIAAAARSARSSSDEGGSSLAIGISGLIR